MKLLTSLSKGIEYYCTMYEMLGGMRPDMLLKLSFCYVYLDKLKAVEIFFNNAIEKKL